MPPQENQEQSPAEPPTPTPTQTPPASTPPGGPNPGAAPSASASGGFQKYLPLAVIGIVVLAVAAVLLSPFSPFKSGPPKGPKLFVGDDFRFVYACSVLDADVVAKTLELNADKQKQNVEESYAFAPANAKDKKLDLIKVTGEESVESTCKLKFDRKEVKDDKGKPLTFVNVSVVVRQFPDEDKASTEFKDAKTQAGNVKTLSSFTDNSYYKMPKAAATGPTYEQAVVLHKNLLIYYTAPLKKGNLEEGANKIAAQLNTLHQDVAKRIDAKKGEKPKNFTNVNKLGDNKFVDACQSVNYLKVAQAIGGEAELEPDYVGTSQEYAPDDNSGQTPKYIASTCNFGFRTKVDADGQKNQKPKTATDLPAIPGIDPPSGSDPGDESYQSKFPHYFTARILATESKETAAKTVTDVKKQADEQDPAKSPIKVEEVKLGDVALRFVNNPALNPETVPGAPDYDTELYYIAKGPYVYLFSLTYVRQNDPYKTTDQKFTETQMGQILKELTAATR